MAPACLIRYWLNSPLLLFAPRVHAFLLFFAFANGARGKLSCLQYHIEIKLRGGGGAIDIRFFSAATTMQGHRSGRLCVYEAKRLMYDDVSMLFNAKKVARFI